MNLEKCHHLVYELLEKFYDSQSISNCIKKITVLEECRADVVYELGLRYGEFDEYVNNNQKKNKEATEANAFAKYPDMRVLLLLKEQIQEAINTEKFLIKDSKV